MLVGLILLLPTAALAEPIESQNWRRPSRVS